MSAQLYFFHLAIKSNAGNMFWKCVENKQFICFVEPSPMKLLADCVARLPVCTGSNPVYLVGNNVVKIFVEGGLEASLYGLGTEVLDCYSVFIPSSGQT
ncbi:F-box protein [Trifolium repens]|nr:F-box protein [Trifolium repens]